MAEETTNLAMQMAGIETPAPEAQPEAEAKPEESAPEQQETPPAQNNPFMPQEQTNTQFETLDQASQYFAQQTGFEIEKPEDLARVADKYKELNETVGTYESENTKLKDVASVYENMPEDLYKVVETQLKGGDYHAEMKKLTNQTLDFSKEQQADYDILNHYFPGEFSKEDLQETGDNAELQRVLKRAQVMYSKDKEIHDWQANKQQQEQQLYEKKLLESYNETVSHLKNTVPNLDKSQMDQIDGILKDGQLGVLKFMFNEDGTFKPNASEMIAWAMYGKQSLEQIQKSQTSKGEQNAIKDIVTRGADNIPTKGGSKSFTENEQVKNYLNQVGLGGGNTFKY